MTTNGKDYPPSAMCFLVKSKQVKLEIFFLREKIPDSIIEPSSEDQR